MISEGDGCRLGPAPVRIEEPRRVAIVEPEAVAAMTRTLAGASACPKRLRHSPNSCSPAEVIGRPDAPESPQDPAAAPEPDEVDGASQGIEVP